MVQSLQFLQVFKFIIKIFRFHLFKWSIPSSVIMLVLKLELLPCITVKIFLVGKKSILFLQTMHYHKIKTIAALCKDNVHLFINSFINEVRESFVFIK